MNKKLSYSYIFFIYALLYIPLLLLISASFFNKQHHFTWNWYRVLANDPILINVTGNSLIVAICAATFSTFLGTLAAIVLQRYRFLGRRLLQTALFTYVILPDLVIGISLLILMHLCHLPLGFFSLLIGHTILCLPFVTIIVNTRLYELDSHLFQSAKDLGASEFILYRRIIIPLILTAVVGAWLMCFTLSMDDVIISFFLTGPSFQVLPLYIYSLTRIGFSPEINAICSVVFFAVLLVILLSQWGFRKR